jgi:hypothetical protein
MYFANHVFGFYYNTKNIATPHQIFKPRLFKNTLFYAGWGCGKLCKNSTKIVQKIY